MYVTALLCPSTVRGMHNQSLKNTTNGKTYQKYFVCLLVFTASIFGGKVTLGCFPENTQFSLQKFHPRMLYKKKKEHPFLSIANLQHRGMQVKNLVLFFFFYKNGCKYPTPWLAKKKQAKKKIFFF